MFRMGDKLVDFKQNEFIPQRMIGIKQKTKTEYGNNSQSSWTSLGTIVPGNGLCIFLIDLPYKKRLRKTLVLDEVVVREKVDGE